jgi:fermentation-respiration switch protein FrsA (DUF1100 family)
VRKAIQRMKPRAMLFIHGEKDSYIPVQQSRLLYALAAQPKFLWIAPGARHNQAVVLHPERYDRLTIGFFDQYLAGLPARQPRESPGEYAPATAPEPSPAVAG